MPLNVDRKLYNASLFVRLITVNRRRSFAPSLHITTLTKDRYTITYRLHLLQVRLDPRRFVRLAQGTIANIDAITKINPMPGGTYVATLSNGQELQVSRLQSRVLRETLLKL